MRAMRKHSPEELERFFAPFVEASSTWARYRADDEAAEGVLVHMSYGEGKRFKDDTKAGRYRCVLPTCDGLFWVQAGDKNVHHWRHRATPSVEHSSETLWHITAKAVLAEFAQKQQPGAVVHHDDKFTPSRNKPDVWVQWIEDDAGPAGDIAFEAQHSAIGTPNLKLRNARYANDGIAPVWLFSHLASPSVASGLSWGAAVRLNEAHRTAADTAPLRWLNPDERIVATAYVCKPERPDDHRGEVWHDDKLDRITYTRHVQPGDTEVSVALDRLDDCVLDAAGLHTPTDRWIELEAAQAADEEAAARAEYLRALGQRLPPQHAVSNRYGPAEPNASASSRQQLSTSEPTPRRELLTRPCVYCGGTPEARTDWPNWYRPPATATEVIICPVCELISGSR